MEAGFETIRESDSNVAVALNSAFDREEHSRNRNQIRLLFEVAEAIAAHRDLTALFRELARRLPSVVPFEVIALFLHDAEKNVLRVHMLGTADADRIPSGSEVDIDQSYSGLVFMTQEPVVVRSAEVEMRFPATQALLRDIGVESFCVLPLTTSVRPLGAIGFGSLSPVAFSAAELEFLGLVARQVAVAVDNVLHDESDQAAQRDLSQERDRLRLLLDVNNAVVSHLAMDEMFAAISAQPRSRHSARRLQSAALRPGTGQYRCHSLGIDGNHVTERGMISELPPTCPARNALGTKEPVTIGEADLRAMAAESALAQRLLDKGVRSICCVPLLSHNRSLGLAERRTLP